MHEVEIPDKVWNLAVEMAKAIGEDPNTFLLNVLYGKMMVDKMSRASSPLPARPTNASTTSLVSQA
jgi:hypothetical protein